MTIIQVPGAPVFIIPAILIPRTPNPSIQAMSSLLARHPWLYIVLAFALLLGAWSTLITIAVKHQPQVIETTAGNR